MSTSRPGRAMRSRIAGISDWPPAISFASSSPPQQLDRVPGGARELVLERRGDHRATPPALAAARTACDDRLVAGAAAEVALEGVADLLPRRGRGSRAAARPPPRRTRACSSRTAARAARGTLAAPDAARRRRRCPRSSSPRSRRPATARTVQDLTASPSTSTVQAPHELVSQPTLVPVRPELARAAGTRAAAAARPRPSCRAPLTVSVIWRVLIGPPPPAAPATRAPRWPACRRG